MAMISQSTLSSSFMNINQLKPQNLNNNEQYYKKIRDSNIIDLIDPNNLNPQAKKIEIFFSLNNVTNPNSLHSFSLTIINNTNIDIKSYLGKLEQRTGENIDFGNTFEIDFFPNRRQLLIIKALINNTTIDWKLELTVIELVNNRFYEKNIPGIGILKLSYCFCDINNIMPLRQYFSNFKFTINLYNMSQICYKGIFFILNQYKDSGKKRPIYKSQIYYTDDIKTKMIKIESDILCNNRNDKISLDLFSIAQMNRPLVKGNFSLNDLLLNTSNNNTTEIELINAYNQMISGRCLINHYQKKKLSFAEKLAKNKMKINLEIAIDYTRSNGLPYDRNSKHYLDPFGFNDYENAIKSCTEILAPYDADQLFPVYGFGGIPKYLNGIYYNKLSHCFNINFEQNAEIYGRDNILNFYRESFKNVELSGNTQFSYVLKKVMSNIKYDLKNRRSENHYYILLILTDGVVNDMQETKDLIVEASSLPLSIIIVGIGNENFTFMEDLDGDEESLKDSRGKKRERDIVQFIEFNKFKNSGTLNYGTDFAEEVLKEIPRQIDEYYEFCGKFF